MSALRQTLLKSVVQNKSQQPKQKQSLGRPPKDPMRHPHHQTELQERAEPPFVPDPSSWERDSDATLQFSFPDRPPRPSEPPQSQQQQLRGTKVSFMSDHSTIPSPVYNRSQRSSTITGNTMATDDSFDGDVDPGQAAIFHQIGMQKSTGDAPPYAEPDEKVLTTSSRPGPTPVQPSLRPPMQTHPEIPSSRKLRQELYDALVLKNKRIQLARRRIRLMEGLALPFWSFISMVGAAVAAAVLVSCWRDARNTGQDGDGSLLILLSIFVPIGIWCMGIAIGLLVQASRNNIRHYLTTYATTDYSETRDLILNLSRLIADIDSSAPPADRKWLLEQATEALTQAVLLKKQFERPAFHRPMYMIFQILCAPFFIFTVLPLSLVIGCAGLDETPRIDGVYQEGLETAMVDRFSLGCCVHISGLGCCCGAAEDKWLAKVAQRSQSLEAQNWGSLSLHSL